MLNIAVAQINCAVGDITGNAQRIVQAAEQARLQGAHVLVAPELALCGYPPEDLLLRADVLQACERELACLAQAAVGIDIILGHPDFFDGARYNAASLLRNGRRIATYRKNRLPNYEVFDEMRYFVTSDETCVVNIHGTAVGLCICADIWDTGPAESAQEAGAELLFVLNASPYHMYKQAQRYEVMRERVASTNMPMLYCNLVGGQDELVFDGASFAMDADGTLTYQAPLFEERVDIIHYSRGRFESSVMTPAHEVEKDVYAALVLGVQDYVAKNNFPGVLIGLSGGIDSALTACIAVDALGADKVHAVMMPSPYTSAESMNDAQELALRLNIRYDVLPINQAMQTLNTMLMPWFEGMEADTTEENLQARLRGLCLMALSNKLGYLVLTTGNKSEMAVGYATLYGDMAGGFAVIKDVYKTFVSRLARYRNTRANVIPHNILVKPPSAELKPNQKDSDSLPPYDVLDGIIHAYMELDESPRQIVAHGYSETDVQQVVSLLRASEYKRRQSPPGVRVTPRGFGKDWRYPISNAYREKN